MLASYCLEPGVVAHDLDSQALRRFGYKKTPRKELLGSGKKQKTFDQVDSGAIAAFVGEDADYALRLQRVMEPELAAAKVDAVLRDMEMPLVPVLLDMEQEGIALDRDRLAQLGREMEKRIAELEARVHERAGHPFNLGSPQQVGVVLFDELEVHRAASLQKPRRTATGQYKTDHEVLEQMAKHHEVPALMLEWRQLTKLKGTYVDTLPTLCDAKSRVHTTFNQAVAATGRERDLHRREHAQPRPRHDVRREARVRGDLDAELGEDGAQGGVHVHHSARRPQVPHEVGL
jgi:DNA polymerase-1